MSRKRLLQRTAMTLGGHAAEKLVFDDIFTGAQSDLQHATSICRSMVTRFGMSEKIGTIYLDSQQEVFVGASFGQSREYSEELAAAVDQEVSSILSSCYQRSMDTLKEHRDDLEKLASVLIERETLSRAEFLAVMEGRELPEREPSVQEEAPVEAHEEKTEENV